MEYKDLPEHDKKLIAKALTERRWEDIDEDAAITEEGKKILHNIAVHAWHMEEGRLGMI